MSFTYRQIRDALAREGFEARQENMGGGCAALTVMVSNEDDRWVGVIIGNGEWGVRESLDEEVWEGSLSVCADDDGEYVHVPEWGDFYRECQSVEAVVAAVRVAFWAAGMRVSATQNVAVSRSVDRPLTVVSRDGVYHVTEGTWVECRVYLNDGWYRGGYQFERVCRDASEAWRWMDERGDSHHCPECMVYAASLAGE